jgi:hypothetical protein
MPDVYRRPRSTSGKLNISAETEMQDWKFAKNWLLRELSRRKSRARDA